MASNIQFHLCSLSNRDISFQYDGWGKVRYSYKDCFNVKGQDYGDFKIAATQAIANAFWRKGQPCPVQGPGLASKNGIYEHSQLSRWLKYVILVRNICDLNQIIQQHNDNPKHVSLLFRIINVILKFFTCDSFTLFDQNNKYEKILDTLLKAHNNGTSFDNYLLRPTRTFKSSEEAVCAFIRSEKGRDLKIYFDTPEGIETLDDLYKLEKGHSLWGLQYLCGSNLDVNGHFLHHLTPGRDIPSSDGHCPDANFT